MVAFAHLPILHLHVEDQTSEMGYIREQIEEVEVRVGHSRTLLIGDLNADPYSMPVVAADGLHAVSDAAIAARRGVRTIRHRQFKMFYNPMWNLMGDFTKPPGSYYFPSAKQTSYFWHTLDQVLIRPALKDYLVVSSLQFITEGLTGETGKPNISDHLPLVFELN